jgi:L-Ala-D/L-Glu epimerase / N-acetyl-D-glutamate racemase
MNPPIEIKIRELQLRDPFGIARGTRRTVRNLFIRIGDGLGEGAPIYYRGQTVEHMAQLAHEWVVQQPDLNRPVDDIIDELVIHYPGETGLWQAIDMALHDALGKKQGESLNQMWSIPQRSDLTSSFTIGMDQLDVVMQKVERAAPYPILKIKVGGRQDLETLQAIAQKTGKPLYIDANEGWSAEQTLEYLPIMQQCNVRMIEQPLPGADRDGYLRIMQANQTGIPIIVDESVHGPEDITKWIGLADGINIKLAKCGGLHRARKMINIARENNLRVMLGCMVESSLGVTAAAHLAPLADYLDLDGAALISNDPFQGMRLDRGKIVMPDGVGIGVSTP